MSEPHGCPGVRELLPELATGALAGDERASALAHVEGCAACRRELAALSRAADALLLLAPPVEPPPGFEGGVLARLGTDAGPALGRRRRRSLLPRVPRLRIAVAFATAVAVAAAAGAQAVRWQSADDRELARQYRQTLQVADGRYLKAVRMTTVDGQPAGTAFFYQGNPSWLLVTVDAAPADGAYDALAIDRDGAAHPAGTCQVTSGTGTAGYRLDVAVAAVAQIQLRSRTVPAAVLTGVPR
ncbi:zf-HC2 domain-containing protein [Phytohabitans sp. ZYX-F-186]|uniref:Zf-HC2 domain-containing protein n=1 Tax=Phytohabitans maris TaxID=3071409 RepID=A0ABU0ZPJ8_9ACTN|nr:zf-HC2 domain-containing protein [Phytohabitans sp. ZYX-F-186]MDQ7908327.1 zf-HC2 domain-containing protein [Phytohabitans sp. ZYX-F-186]